MNEDLPETRCWACSEVLKVGQRYCKECRHWQNWRAYTTVSSTILSLIIALLAVLGAVAPRIYDLFKQETAAYYVAGKVEASSGAENAFEFAITVANVGDIIGRIPPRLTCWPGTGIFTGENYSVLETFHASTVGVVLPGEREVVNYFGKSDSRLLHDQFSCDLGHSAFEGHGFPNHLLNFEGSILVWSWPFDASGYVPEPIIAEPVIIEEMDE